MSKKLLVSILGLIIMSCIVTKTASAVITGSKHDFSTISWNKTGEICIVCHTPHNASTTSPAPLWNHTQSTASYTLYSSTTLKAVMGQPNAASKACLSCHDGTVALNSFGSNGTTTDTFLTGSHDLGTDLSNDHPISFTYDTALSTSDVGVYDPSVQPVPGFGTKTIAQAMLIGGKTLECSSCHDVHRDKGASAGVDDLLLVDNTGSALCLTCHKK